MPSRLMLAALSHWVLAVATCGLGAVVLVGRSMSDETLFSSIWHGASVALFGALNVPAALAIYGPHFPQVVLSRIASFVTFAAFGSTLARSALHGDAMTVPSLGVAAIMVLCVLTLFLTTGPKVKQWTTAKRQLSLSQGHRPRR